MPERPRGRTRPGLGSTALLGLGYFGAAVACLHVLRHDYRPSRHMISDYAVGPFGWLMTTAFLALAVCCFSLMLGLRAFGPRAIPARLGVVLLGVASAGLVVTAIFPTDLPGTRGTTSGSIHTATFLLNVGSLLLATILLSASYRRDARWRPTWPAAVGLAAFVVVAFVLQFLSLRPGAPYGLANRLFVVALLSWLTLVGLRLKVVEKGADRRSRSSA